VTRLVVVYRRSSDGAEQGYPSRERPPYPVLAQRQARAPRGGRFSALGAPPPQSWARWCVSCGQGISSRLIHVLCLLPFSLLPETHIHAFPASSTCVTIASSTCVTCVTTASSTCVTTASSTCVMRYALPLRPQDALCVTTCVLKMRYALCVSCVFNMRLASSCVLRPQPAFCVIHMRFCVLNMCSSCHYTRLNCILESLTASFC
jgi:hypothetical protein